VFPGPDQKLGTYLAYPRPTDPEYRTMTYPKALAAIGKYINDTNPLGQRIEKNNPSDPGKDDDYAKNPGRPLILPVQRTIDIHLTSKDVLHDFFLPTFRVKLDAVPGMRGHIIFKGVPEGRSTQVLALEKVPADKPIWLDPSTPGVVAAGNPKRYRLPDPTDRNPVARRRAMLDSLDSLDAGARRRLQRGGTTVEQMKADPSLVAAEVEKLRADLAKMGITQFSTVVKPHEIVCEELCGLGHGKMRGEMLMVSNEEYMHYLNLNAPPGGTPATRPATPPVASAKE
jgi:hypothetical protein